MKVQAIYKEGLYVELTESLSVFYHKDQHKVKLLRNGEVVNHFVVEPKQYKLSEFIEYCEEIKNSVK